MDVLRHFDPCLHLTSPEGVHTLCLEDPDSAVRHTIVGLVKTSLLDHLILVLDQQLHSLDRSGDCLGDSSGHARQHEVLREAHDAVSHAEGEALGKGTKHNMT